MMGEHEWGAARSVPGCTGVAGCDVAVCRLCGAERATPHGPGPAIVTRGKERCRPIRFDADADVAVIDRLGRVYCMPCARRLRVTSDVAVRFGSLPHGDDPCEACGRSGSDIARVVAAKGASQ